MKIKFIILPILALALLVDGTWAEWIKVEPIKEPPVKGALGDIESYLPNGNPYKEADKVGWAHEGTHGVNSKLRQRYAEPGYNVLYQLDGWAIRLKEPNLTLMQVAQSIPSKYRGDMYALYMERQQEYFNKEPLYMLDELTAYLNGTIVGLDYNVDSARVKGSFKYVLQMRVYIIYLQQLMKSGELDEHMLWLDKRIRIVSEKMQKKGLYDSRHGKWAAILAAELQYNKEQK
jgi:hypothetical protein